MSTSAPLPTTAASEVDFMAPLRPAALVKIAALCAVGGVLGLGAGTAFIKHAEAKAVLRVGTVGALGPVVPLSEVKARAESYGGLVEAMKKLGDPNPELDAKRYKVTAETDATRDGTVVMLTFAGPDESSVESVAKARLESLLAFTHEAYLKATAANQARLSKAEADAEALKKAGAAAVDPASAASFERWAGELDDARRSAQHDVLLTADSDVIDPPHPADAGARKLLIAALGCFAGLLLGLALTARPAKAP